MLSAFIPSNDKDSSIPAAFFTAEVINTSDKTMTYTFELSVNNPTKKERINVPIKGEKFHGIELTHERLSSAAHTRRTTSASAGLRQKTVTRSTPSTRETAAASKPSTGRRISCSIRSVLASDTNSSSLS